MLKVGSDLYLRFFVESDVRILNKASVSGISDLGPAIEVDKPDPRLQAGVALLVYYETSRGFVEQVARIERVEQLEPTALIQLAMSCDSIDAEARAHGRVRLPLKQVVCNLDGEECPVQDVSDMGFAVTSKQSFAPGQIVSVCLEHGVLEYRGRAQIRNFSGLADLHPCGEDRSRYGLLVEPSGAGETLAEGLNALTASVPQR